MAIQSSTRFQARRDAARVAMLVGQKTIHLARRVDKWLASARTFKSATASHLSTPS